MRRLELVEGTSSKFWEIAVEGDSTTVRFGRIGTEGRTQTKAHGTSAAAEKAALELIAEKTSKGYVEVTGGAAPAPVSRAANSAPALQPAGVALLAPAVEKKLLAKLPTTEDADAAAKVLTKAAPGGDFNALLADLARRQKLGLERGVVELLQRTAGELDPAAIHALLDGFGDHCVGEPGDDYPVLPGFGREELAVLSCSYEKHPGYWDGATLSRTLEGALALVHARAGRPVGPGVGERVLDELVAGVTTLVGLPDNAYRLGITPEEFGRRTLPIVRANAMPLKAAAADALVLMPWTEARPILAACSSAWGRTLLDVLRRRDDAPADLLAFADEAPFEIDVFGYVLVGTLPRIAAAGLPLPDAWDESLQETIVEFDRDRSGLAEAFAGAEAAISVERRHRIIRAALASGERGHFACALLRHAWDPALFDEALSRLKDKPALTASAYHDESESLGLVGAPALPRLAQALEESVRTPETGLASALWQSLLVAAAATAEAGELDERYLNLLVLPGFSMGSLEQFGRDRYWQRLLRALPRTRAEAIVKQWQPIAGTRAECCVPAELMPPVEAGR